MNWVVVIFVIATGIYMIACLEKYK